MHDEWMELSLQIYSAHLIAMCQAACRYLKVFDRDLLQTEPHNQEIGNFFEVHEGPSTEFEALKFGKGRSGGTSFKY